MEGLQGYLCKNSFKLVSSDQTDQSALGFDLVDLEDPIEGQVFIYLDREDKDEKTVERSPELSVGNGGELDLLEMEKSKNPKISKIETHSSAGRGSPSLLTNSFIPCEW